MKKVICNYFRILLILTTLVGWSGEKVFYFVFPELSEIFAQKYLNETEALPHLHLVDSIDDDSSLKTDLFDFSISNLYTKSISKSFVIFPDKISSSVWQPPKSI
ncbi:MAG: hypothetical protein IPH20_11890 [Bacteroidales bacterium]|nr:hypothetical protein [Bacteroidales bacterium]